MRRAPNPYRWFWGAPTPEVPAIARACAISSSSSGDGWQLQQHSQHAANSVAHVAAVHDHVEHAVLEEKLASLEAFRKRLAYGLLNDARAGESDQGTRLGNVE